ncbi:MAG: thermonuclease family protein [Patescibacteria group bacterium]
MVRPRRGFLIEFVSTQRNLGMGKIRELFSGRKKFLTIPVATVLGLFFFPITIGLLLAWFVYAKVGNKKLKFAALAVIGVFALFFGGTYIAALVSPTPSKETTQVESQPTPTPEVEGQQTEVTPTPNPDRREAKVTRVIDGDTIEIEGGQRVRYIGMDTPEKDACFSNESTAKNKVLVEGKTIVLEKDVSETDRYGCLLRYVYVGDSMVNEVLVKEGYAEVYTYPPDVKYNERFLAAQKDARDKNRGLWSSCLATPTPTSGGACKYSCTSPDRDCSDFVTHAEAQTFFECCGFTATYDPMKLDSTGVGDGIACESRP